MCDPCCLIVDCVKVSYEVPRPSNLEEAGGNMICPHCSKVCKPIYKKDKSIFTICFIPLCPCGTSDVYMACSCCEKKVNVAKESGCSNCHVVTPFDAEFCPNCGANKRSNEHVRQLNIQ